MSLLRLQGNRASGGFRTVCLKSTDTTILNAELNANNRTLTIIIRIGPTRTGMTCGSGQCSLFPVYLEVFCRKSLVSPCLPPLVMACWTNKVNLMLLLFADQKISTQKTHIY